VLRPGYIRNKASKQSASVIGLYQITNLSEIQRKVLEYPEFKHMKIDFNSYLQKSVECLLKGLIQ
jgi:hypothetical protein